MEVINGYDSCLTPTTTWLPKNVGESEDGANGGIASWVCPAHDDDDTNEQSGFGGRSTYSRWQRCDGWATCSETASEDTGNGVDDSEASAFEPKDCRITGVIVVTQKTQMEITAP
jgi:hypothetical protein